MEHGARKSEWRRTRERRLVRRALQFYGSTLGGAYVLQCLETRRLDGPLALYVVALVVVATGLHAHAGVTPPNVAFKRVRRAKG